MAATSDNLLWDPEDRPDFVIDAPFANVQVGFGLEKGSITVTGKFAGKSVTLYAAGWNTNAPRIGYLQIRPASPVNRWRLSDQLSKTNFARPDGTQLRILSMLAASSVAEGFCSEN